MVKPVGYDHHHRCLASRQRVPDGIGVPQSAYLDHGRANVSVCCPVHHTLMQSHPQPDLGLLHEILIQLGECVSERAKQYYYEPRLVHSAASRQEREPAIALFLYLVLAASQVGLAERVFKNIGQPLLRRVFAPCAALAVVLHVVGDAELSCSCSQACHCGAPRMSATDIQAENSGFSYAVTMTDWPPGSLLGMIPDAARERLLRRGVLVRYPGPSRILFRERDESAFVAIILRGVVKVTGGVLGGPDALLAIRMGGDAVGEFAAVDQLPRSATVTTCGNAVARVIKAEDFTDCIRRDPDISHAITKAIVAKMRVSSQRRLDFSGSDVSVRVARLLLHLVTSYGKPSLNGDMGQAVIPMPLTQPELASLAVASPPAVQRVLRRLREDGILATGYRSVTVLDVKRLRLAADTEPGRPS